MSLAAFNIADKCEKTLYNRIAEILIKIYNAHMFHIPE